MWLWTTTSWSHSRKAWKHNLLEDAQRTYLLEVRSCVRQLDPNASGGRLVAANFSDAADHAEANLLGD